MTSPIEVSFTDTSKPRRFSKKSNSRVLLAFPTALFAVGCVLIAFEMVMNSARGVGATTLTMHLVAGLIFLVILGIPFACQMHTTGNDKGLALGIALWVLVGLFNLGTLMSYWPLRLAIAANESKLLGIHRSLGPDESRSMAGVGSFRFKEVRRLPNGNTWFITGGHPGGEDGLVYFDNTDHSGVNEWSNIRINERWSVVEED